MSLRIFSARQLVSCQTAGAVILGCMLHDTPWLAYPATEADIMLEITPRALRASERMPGAAPVWLAHSRLNITRDHGSARFVVQGSPAKPAARTATRASSRGTGEPYDMLRVEALGHISGIPVRALQPVGVRGLAQSLERSRGAIHIGWTRWAPPLASACAPCPAVRRLPLAQSSRPNDGQSPPCYRVHSSVTRPHCGHARYHCY
jgi:hypothetical protein